MVTQQRNCRKLFLSVVERSHSSAYATTRKASKHALICSPDCSLLQQLAGLLEVLDKSRHSPPSASLTNRSRRVLETLRPGPMDTSQFSG